MQLQPPAATCGAAAAAAPAPFTRPLPAGLTCLLMLLPGAEAAAAPGVPPAALPLPDASRALILSATARYRLSSYCSLSAPSLQARLTSQAHMGTPFTELALQQ